MNSRLPFALTNQRERYMIRKIGWVDVPVIPRSIDPLANGSFVDPTLHFKHNGLRSEVIPKFSNAQVGAGGP